MNYFQNRRSRWTLLAVTAALGGGGLLVSQERAAFGVLASNVLMGKQDAGFYLVATNQLLRPWGEQWTMRGRPVEITMHSGGQMLAVLNSRGVHLLHSGTGTEVAQIASRSTSYTGLAFRPGGRELWASEATRTGPDGILIARLDAAGRPQGQAEHVALPGHPVPTGIAFSPDGSQAFVAMSDKNSIAVLDADSHRIVKEVPVGMVPWYVAASAKRKQLYVSNRGGRRPVQNEATAYSSAVAVATDPTTGATTTGTVSIVDMESMAERQIAVGLAPAGVAVSPDENMLAVANAHSDSVTFIDLQSLRTQEVKVPAYPAGSFGSTPSSAAFSPDGRTVYVTCGGSNSVAVLGVDSKGKWASKGALPTGWFPTAIAVDREGSLRIVNVKGTGSTRNDKGTHNAREFEGSVTKIPAPQQAQLQAGTREVAAASQPRFTPTGGASNLAKLGIRHVFLIIKENRTYDQVFGDMDKGRRDPKLTMYGRNVTPNHHALAEQYVLLDNFYTGGAISFDGHQWLMQGFVSDYVERAFAASPRGYAWNMADALTVSPAGFFWQDARRPVDVGLHGPFSLPVTWDPSTQRAVDINESQLLSWGEYWRLYKENKWRDAVGHRSGVPALQKYVAGRYPPSSMNIPDQIRADAWLEELAEREKTGQMPHLLIFTMTSDHAMGTRPGYPTPRAMVADNDLAMGRMVEGITKSRFWPNSLILITEDDAQDGIDSVDGRRTICLAIGPRVKRGGSVDSNHYNHSSLIRTIQDVYGIQPKVRYAASARAMNSLFVAKPDLTPYKALTPEVSLTEMNPPVRGLSGRQLWAARQSMGINPHEVDEFPAQVMNRILWWDAKGYETPFPEDKAGGGPRY